MDLPVRRMSRRALQVGDYVTCRGYYLDSQQRMIGFTDEFQVERILPNGRLVLVDLKEDKTLYRAPHEVVFHHRKDRQWGTDREIDRIDGLRETFASVGGMSDSGGMRTAAKNLATLAEKAATLAEDLWAKADEVESEAKV